VLLISGWLIFAALAIHDAKSHLISRSLLLILIGISLLSQGFITARILMGGVLIYSFYLAIYCLSKRALGYGDVRLAFSSFFLFHSSDLDILKIHLIAWIMAFIWAVTKSGERQVAFAPFLFTGGVAILSKKLAFLE
jgi:prepilin signal peptidase PulO-like enzyme (type II secretory pathway)